MSFPLANSPIADKIRQSMYLKHMREVERINNRDPEAVKKELSNYYSISQLHKRNKEQANHRKLEQHQQSIELKNLRIFNKIRRMNSDQRLKQTMKNSNALALSMAKESSHSPDLDRTHSTHRPYDSLKKTLHSRYRKKEQDRISEENLKIAKAISNQKSALLPLLGKSKRAWSSLGENTTQLSSN